MASQKKSKKDDRTSRLGFGDYLRGLRAQQGLTLREVAAAVGMDQAHLSKAELGQRLPTPAQAGALAHFFRQDLVEFEGHCIAEKFRRKHAGSAAALHAIRLLQGAQASTAPTRGASGRTTKEAVKKVSVPPSLPVNLPPMPAAPVEAVPEENPGVVVLHTD